MTKLPQNIDRSFFRKGEYVLYRGQAPIVRIRRGGKGWETYECLQYHTARTLNELSKKFK